MQHEVHWTPTNSPPRQSAEIPVSLESLGNDLSIHAGIDEQRKSTSPDKDVLCMVKLPENQKENMKILDSKGRIEERAFRELALTK